MLTERKTKLFEILTTLELPTFKTAEIEFIQEYVAVLTPFTGE